MGYKQGFRATWSEQLACFLGDWDFIKTGRWHSSVLSKYNLQRMQKASSGEWPQSHEQPQDPIRPSIAVLPPCSMDHVLCKLPQQERDYGATQVSLPITNSLPNNKVTAERTAKIHIQGEQNIYRWNVFVQSFYWEWNICAHMSHGTWRAKSIGSSDELKANRFAIESVLHNLECWKSLQTI